MLLMIFKAPLPYYFGHLFVKIKAKLRINWVMLLPVEQTNSWDKSLLLKLHETPAAWEHAVLIQLRYYSTLIQDGLSGEVSTRTDGERGTSVDQQQWRQL